jgi:aspartate/tyrosine/aromatic aminotransferase
LTVVAAPLFYGQLYARLGDRAAYLGGAAVVAIAELCHRSLSLKDLELPDKSASAASKPSKASDAAAFDAVTVVPPDPVFFVSQQYQACTAEIKLNLGVGAYRTNDGKPLVLDVVKKAEQMVTDKLSDDSFNIEYLPIDGLPAFRAETTKLILGKTSPAIAEGRVACCQSLSGTGALRLAAEFIAVNLGTNRTVHISNPTWGNHKAIFGKAGLPVAQYSYFKPETKGLDFEGMTADLEKVKPGDVVLLHGCAHNPTGVDPTMDQWKQIAALIKQQKALPFFDCAYQGYASGDLDTDAAAVRYFESEGIEMMIAQSYSKNFGLYGERIGALSITTNDGPEIAKAIQSQLKKIVRPMYSNPPSNGARIVAQVLADPALYAEWVAELKGMSGRIIEMRAALRKGLEELKPDMDWTFITTQIGMFAYTGLSEAQVERLTKEFNIFMLKSGRISMAGVSSGTVQYLAESIAKVV